jgi:hypothetical protein
MSEHNGVVVEDSFPPRGNIERRRSLRCSCRLNTSCQPVPLPTASQPEISWHGTVDDISVGGLKMTLRRRFEVGTPLIIELPGAIKDFTTTLAGQVAHVSPRPGGGWIIGCEFDKQLKPEDLKSLL